MANEEQLKILDKGADLWNKWRSKNSNLEVDLSSADLRKTDLSGAHLGRTNLRQANLRQANLRQANLSQADLREADLSEADLSTAYLSGTDFRNADLSGADLRRANISAELWPTNLGGANLSGANLGQADLTGADLRGALLIEADFGRAQLAQSNFLEAAMGITVFGNSDLSETIGLEDILHTGPSRISTDTFALSKGKIPEDFLRGCGLPDWEIASVRLYNPDLSNEEINQILYKMYDLRATQALQISPLFISYGHPDSAFVSKVGDNLTKKGIRYWRDIHDMKAGRMEKQIDRAIRQNPTVLLVLSEHSLSSDWVEHEVRTARGLEKEMERDVLCPVALDDSWKSSRWPKRIMEQIMEYNILDFSEWEDDVKFEGMFRKLIDGLELFYKG